MPSLIGQSQINILTGQIDNLFQTMTTGRNSYIIVEKEPVENVVNTTSNVLAAYGPDINQTNVTYIPVTGVFPAIVIYPYKSMNLDKFITLKFPIDLNSVYIKVKQDCRDYIRNGKTERIIADNNPYITQDLEQVQNYFGLKYYYFKLNSTQ